MTLYQMSALLAEASRSEMNLTALRVLCLLYNHGRLKMSFVANQSKVTPAAMTGAADRLEKAGLIRRVYDEADRRVIELEVLQPGKELIDKMLGNIARSGA